jgi:putative oxidoreductase
MTFFHTTSDRQAGTALMLLRVLTGIIFTAHGAQKLFVMGFAGVSGGFGQMGIPMPGVMGPFISLLEFFGGVALILGLLTRLASLGLAFDMLGAILLVHLRAGFFLPTGYEFALLLLGTTAALVVAGAGRLAVDNLFATRFETAAVATSSESHAELPKGNRRVA